MVEVLALTVPSTGEKPCDRKATWDTDDRSYRAEVPGGFGGPTRAERTCVGLSYADHFADAPADEESRDGSNGGPKASAHSSLSVSRSALARTWAQTTQIEHMYYTRPMAMGKRERDRQLPMWVTTTDLLRRSIFPACDALGLPRATWLTFRRTYSSWAHDKSVPGKVVAQLMGHTNVDVTLNVYTQVLDGSLRAAVEKVGDELFTIVHQPEEAGSLTD